MATTKVISATTKTAPNDSGVNTGINWLETSALGTSTSFYAVQDTAVRAKVLLRGSGDTVMIEGFASEYKIKQSGKTVTLQSDTQTIVLILNSATAAAITGVVSDTITFLDGSVSLGNTSKSLKMKLGTQALTNKFVDITAPLTESNTDATDYFDGGTTTVGKYLLTAVASDVEEGSSVTFTLTLDKSPTEDVTVAYNTVAGTASTADYTSTAGTVTFAAGQTVAFVTVNTINDSTVELTETLTLNVTGTQLTAAATGTVNITDALDAATPPSFTLTTGVDTLVGTAANDTYNSNDAFLGLNVATIVNGVTLNAGDSIDGGAGTDTLNITTATATTFDFRTSAITNVEKLVINDAANTINNGNMHVDGSFTDVTLKNFNNATVYGVNEGATVTEIGNANTNGTGADVYFNASTDTTVTMNDTFQGNATSSNGRADFYHGNQGAGLSKATTINATLNLLNANLASNSADWITQTIEANNVGNVATAITTTTNITNATSDESSNYSGTDTYIYRNADATVNSTINITNSADVYAEVAANRGNSLSEAKNDTLTVNLNGVTNGNYSAVYGYDFETVKVNVSGAAVELDDLSFYNSNDNLTATTAQTVTIVANKDLTVGSSSYNDQGSVSSVISGSGNVDLGNYDGTSTVLSTTVSDKIDASALTGNFKVRVNDDINVVKGGSGNDRIVLTNVATFDTAASGGLVVSGAAGTDTIGLAGADFITITTAATATSTASLAAISGFEVLEITDALANATTYDVSKIAGVTSFVAGAGVTATKAATISNLGANASVTLSGANANSGSITGTLKTDGANDTVNLILNKDFTDNNGTTSTQTAVGQAVTMTTVENLVVTATGVNTSLPFTPVTDYLADTIGYGLTVTDDALVTLTVKGDQQLSFSTAATQLALTTIDASTNTGGVIFDASLTDTVANGAALLTIKGSATAANQLTGSANADTIIGGSKADSITGGAGADAITVGAGNDIIIVSAATDSTLINKDVITGFSANTYGQGTAGAANQLGATATTADRTGDVIDLSFATPTNLELSVQTNSADAQVAIQNAATDGTYASVNIALDSSSGNVYIDIDNNGTVDTVIQLSGVTTLTTAAFVI